MANVKDIARKRMNELELRVIEQLLYQQADIINALMRDGIPYTKVEVPNG